METVTTSRAPQPRPHEELLAVVEGDRLLVASSALLALVGYSRAEATGPEFRAAYLFHPDSSRAPLRAQGGAGPFDVLLARPGGAPERYHAYTSPIPASDAPEARTILFTRDPVEDIDAMPEHALRALVASLRSATSDALARLRRVDDELAALGSADPEILRSRAGSLVRSRVGYHGLDESLVAVERQVRARSPFR